MLESLKRWLGPRRIDTLDALEAYIGTETARTAQKATTGYCRLKAGSNHDLLFKEQGFLDALDDCRWGAFGQLLADFCLVAEGYLRPHAAGREAALAAWITQAFDRGVDAHADPSRAGHWDKAKEEMRARLARARLSPPIPAANIGFDTARRVYDSLPLHASQTGDDFEVVQNLIRFGHVTFRSELERLADPQAIIRGLPG